MLLPRQLSVAHCQFLADACAVGTHAVNGLIYVSHLVDYVYSGGFGLFTRQCCCFQVLAEPIQTVMRKYAVDNAYEKLKEFTRGRAVSSESMQTFVDGLEGVPDDVKAEMRAWTPANYVGLAQHLAQDVRKHY